MIPLQRVRDPQAIHAGFHSRGRLEKLLKLLNAHRSADPAVLRRLFQGSAWKDTKDQLRAETFGKCAYCEAHTANVAHGDVEHFRPKSVYWWLAFCYDNYLFSCQVCNQTFKGDRFPTRGTRLAVDPPLPDPFPTDLTPAQLAALAAALAPDPLDPPAVDRFRRGASREKAMLVDPYHEDPSALFKWVADPVQQEVAIAARFPNRVASRSAFEAARDVLGLNRDELKRVRWQTYRNLEIFRSFVASPAVPEGDRRRVAAEIRSMMEPRSAFAGMSRYFVQVEWRLNLDLDG